MDLDWIESMARLHDRMSTVIAENIDYGGPSLQAEMQKQQLEYAISQNWLALAEREMYG